MIIVMLSRAKHLAEPWPDRAGLRSFVRLRVTNARVTMTFWGQSPTTLWDLIRYTRPYS